MTCNFDSTFIFPATAYRGVSVSPPLQKIPAALQKMALSGTSFFKLMQTSRFLSLTRNMLAIHIRSAFLFREANVTQIKEAKVLLLITGWISKVAKLLQVDTNFLGQFGCKLQDYPNEGISYEPNRLYLFSE